MSLLIASPLYGGFCYEAYFRSCLSLQEELLVNNIDYDFLITSNESLITRARNTSAKKFLDSRFENLLFIDADIEFTPEDVSKLYTMASDVCCGAYARKKDGETAKVWVGGERELSEFTEPVEVDYAGTGFMLIRRHVFDALDVPTYQEGVGECRAFFQDPVVEENGSSFHISEDYFFCKKVREAGMKVTVDPSIKLTHWGKAGY